MRTITFILAISLLSFLTACEKSFDELNIDPKSPVDVPANSVFLAGEKGLVDLYTTSIWTSSPFRVLSQVWTQTANINEARYQFVTNNAPGGWWDRIYTIALSNLEQAKGLYEGEKLPAAVKTNKLFITDILEVYSFHLLVNTFGNIPYSEALDRKIPFPKYDDAKTVTEDLIKRLDADIAGLDVNADSFGSADQIYQGKVAKWKKFAASLKLKLALYLADADQALSRTKVAEAIQSGVFGPEEGNSNNANFPYAAGVVINSNPLYQDLVTGIYGTYYAPAAFFINTLITWNDPRLPILFSKDAANGYSGAVAGAGGVNQELSKFSSKWLDPAAPGVLLDYAEVEFLLAEAAERGFAVSGTAASHYQAAVTASITSLGGSADDAVQYLAQPAVNYATAAGDWKQKVGYQKWIAFANRNWDSWTEIRRLGYPSLDVVSPPQGAQGKLPLRFYYPPAEQNSNAAHLQEAVSALPGGKDEVSAKLFWIP
ncbi:Starch-binding associating with outer membrane [bacterium A37T11]|nr:Starch-binding associating with outer membrane [bacterium A37T11]